MSTVPAAVRRTWRRVVPRGHPAEQAVRSTARQAGLRVAPPGGRLRRFAQERLARRGFTTTELADHVQLADADNLVLRSRVGADAARVGIYLAGGCDLPGLFRLSGPIAADGFRGTMAIRQAGWISSNHPDLLLQQLDPPARATQIETIANLRLRPDYFEPTLFQRTFEIPGQRHLGPFPKTVVVLSLGAGVVRGLYRHREHGFLVDPGGFWLEHSMADVLAERGVTLEWFKQTFEKVGRRNAEEVAESLERLVSQVQARTGALVVVSNTLTVDIGGVTHNYQLKRRPEALNRRRFHLALAEVSRRTGCLVLDVDRVLKAQGIEGMVDFAHYPASVEQPLCAATHRMLVAHDVFSDRPAPVPGR